LDFEVTAPDDYTTTANPGMCFYNLLGALISTCDPTKFPARVSCEVAGSAVKRDAVPIEFAGNSNFRRNGLMLYDSGSPQTYPVLYAANQFLTDFTASHSSQLGFGIEIVPQAVSPGINPYVIDPYVAGTYASWARTNGFGEVFVWVMDCTAGDNLYDTAEMSIPTNSISLPMYQMYIQEILNAMLLNQPQPGNYPVVPTDENCLFYLYTMSSPPDKAILNNTAARPPLTVGTARQGQIKLRPKSMAAIEDTKPVYANRPKPATTVTNPHHHSASKSKSDSAKNGVIIAAGVILIAILVAVTTWACTKKKIKI
jgi:hypothetical protein